MKICSLCSQTKAAEDYAPHAHTKDKLRPQCRECKRKQDREYAAKNRQKRIEATRRYKQEHPEKYKAAVRAWSKKNPLAVKASLLRRRALQQNLDCGCVTKQSLEVVFAVFGNKCVYCSEGRFECLDHVVALSQNGRHCFLNLVPSCTKCNSSKWKKSLYDWLGDDAASKTRDAFETRWAVISALVGHE